VCARERSKEREGEIEGASVWGRQAGRRERENEREREREREGEKGRAREGLGEEKRRPYPQRTAKDCMAAGVAATPHTTSFNTNWVKRQDILRWG
jgi:hypothetical protein